MKHIQNSVLILMVALPLWAQSIVYPQLQGVVTGEESPSGKLQQAVAVDVDADGNVYIIDQGNNRLLKYSEGEFVREVGGFGNEGDQLDDPRDVDASLTLDILVADYNNERIVRFDRNLNFVAAYSGQVGEGETRFGRVKSVAFSNQLEIFLIDDDRRQVVKLDRVGQSPLYFGGPEEPYGQLFDPLQLTVGTQQVFVSDPGQSAVLIYDFLGNFIHKIRSKELQPGSVDWSPREELFVVNQHSGNVLVFNKQYELQYRLAFRELTAPIRDLAVWVQSGTQQQFVFVLLDQECRKYEFSVKP